MDEPNMVTRRLKVGGLDTPPDGAGDWLRALDGVVEAAIEAERGVVTVSYDLRRATLAQVVERLEAVGLPPAGGMLDRLRRGWAAFTEENIRSNLAHQGHCCSKPPAGR